MRKRESSGSTREKILHAAIKCFSRKGYNEATMDEIAQEAGVSKGSLYWHFKSKSSLFLAIKKLQIERIIGILKESLTSTQPFTEKLKNSINFYFASLSKNEKRPTKLDIEFWAAASRMPAISYAIHEQYNLLKSFLNSTIKEAIDKGEVKEDIKVDALSAIMLATLDGLVLHSTLVRYSFNWSEIRDTLYRVLIHGVIKEGREIDEKSN